MIGCDTPPRPPPSAAKPSGIGSHSRSSFLPKSVVVTATLLDALAARCRSQRREACTAHAHHAVAISSVPRRALSLPLHVHAQSAANDVLPGIGSSHIQFQDEPGRCIFDNTIFGTKIHRAAAPTRALSLSSAILCTPSSALLQVCSFAAHQRASLARRTIACRQSIAIHARCT